MTARRGWLLALIGTSLLSGVVLGLSTGIGVRFWVGVSIMAVFLIVWATAARTHDDPTRSVVILIVMFAVAGALTAVATPLAFFQTFAFPAAWTLLSTSRRSILASAVLSVVEVAGFLIRLGIHPDSIVLALAIEGVSLVFAIVMGLWITRIADLSNERQRLLDELTAAQRQLEVLHHDAGATGERERLARELHDTIAQSLTAQVLLAQRARREFAAGTLSDDTLELLETSSRDTLTETRTLVAAGARVELPGGDLLAALEQLASRFERESSITVVVSSTMEGIELPRDTEVVLLRCAQEGLANVRKHAGAHEASVRLAAADGFASVTVVDNGRGFDPKHAASGFGLSGLRDRLGLAGGDLTIDGTASATTLTARLPLEVGA